VGPFSSVESFSTLLAHVFEWDDYICAVKSTLLLGQFSSLHSCIYPVLGLKHQFIRFRHKLQLFVFWKSHHALVWDVGSC
jgi:hypothetical protein